MKKSKTEVGWVIVSPDGNIYDFTFKRTRINSINRWNKVRENPNWRKDRRKGYRCVKAKQTTELF